MKHIKPLLIAALSVTAFAANATVVFSDNFDSTAFALNTTPSGWSVTSGSVDVVKTNTFSLTCAGATGRCVDLDGSTNLGGTLSKTFASISGMTYNLSFDLAGNQRTPATDTVTVSFGTQTGSWVLAKNAPWTTYQLSFTAASNAGFALSFKNSGGDNQGALLDNVLITAVPEPETYAMLLAGLGLMAGIARRRKNKSA